MANLLAKIIQKKHALPLHVFLMVLFSLLIFGSGTIIGFLSYWNNKEILLAGMQKTFLHIGSEAENKLEALQHPVINIVSLLSRSPLAQSASLEARLENVPLLVEVLQQNPSVEAVFASYINGDFFAVSHFNPAHSYQLSLDIPADTRYIVYSIESVRGPLLKTLFLDANLQTLDTHESAEYYFDPQERPWYRNAMAQSTIVVSQPYVFITTHRVGTSIVKSDEHKHFIAGASIALDELSAHLRQSLKTIPARSAELVIFDDEGRIIAYSGQEKFIPESTGHNHLLLKLKDMQNPVLQNLQTRLDQHAFNTPLSLDVDGIPWHALITHTPWGDHFNVHLAIAAPEAELLETVRRQLHYDGLVTLSILLLMLPLTWYMSRYVSKSLRALTETAQAAHQFDFSNRPAVNSIIKEVRELSSATNHAHRTIRRFLDISTTLTTERNFWLLTDKVLQETLETIDAHIGILYLVDDHQNALIPEAVHYAPPYQGQDAANNLLKDLPNIPLDPKTADPAVQSVIQKETISISLIFSALDKNLQLLLGKGHHYMISLPLKNGAVGVIGVLCLLRPNTEKGPSLELTSFTEQLSGVAAVAIENKRLLLHQSGLLDGLIKLIAGAIDSKSPYTGGHCQRIPELAKMLAQVACAQTTGPFANFKLDEQGWEALRVGTWLHDCGKVTTPEHVVDKATKLETIYDRLHEIRMRFEVLKRDSEITYWQSLCQGKDEREARLKRDDEWQKLDEEFAFIAECNTGGEFMAPEKLEKLQVIAQRTWKRTLSDRIGISEEEKQRKSAFPEPALPVNEPLLADKPEHLIERPPNQQLPEDNPWGFRIAVPRHEYNYGELTNLSIRRGTLTAEERYKINDHIMQTIIMLSCLPWPPHLKTVPEIAGGHHEKMNGKGYPKGLTRNQMSQEARMVAIADIFEALTAADRPYKKRKTLSEALAIMAHMKQEEHIDPDWFDLFIQSGVYMEYAKQYLEADQIDEIDINSLLA